MWHRDTKWANALVKTVPIDLLDSGLPQTFNLWKRHYLRSAVKQRAIKWGLPVDSFCCSHLPEALPGGSDDSLWLEATVEGRRLSDGIKGLISRPSDKERSLGQPGGPNVITSVIKWRREKQESQCEKPPRKEDSTCRRWLGRWRKGAEAKKCGASGNGKKTDSL